MWIRPASFTRGADAAFAATLLAFAAWSLLKVGLFVSDIAAGEVTDRHPRGTGTLYAAHALLMLIASLLIGAAWRLRAHHARLRTKTVVAVVLAALLGGAIAAAKADADNFVAVGVLGVIVVLSAASILLELRAPGRTWASGQECPQSPKPVSESRTVTVRKGAGDTPLSAAEAARRRLWNP